MIGPDSFITIRAQGLGVDKQRSGLSHSGIGRVGFSRKFALISFAERACPADLSHLILLFSGQVDSDFLQISWGEGVNSGHSFNIDELHVVKQIKKYPTDLNDLNIKNNYFFFNTVNDFKTFT